MGCHETKKTRMCVLCPPNPRRPPYCAECRSANLERLDSQYKVDAFKKVFFRNPLISNPLLGLDMQTGLQGAAGMSHILEYVENKVGHGAWNYCLFFMDVDNLKALNSAYTHDGANEILFDIAGVLNKYAQKVNGGEYVDEEDVRNSLHRAWAFRFVNVSRLSANMRGLYTQSAWRRVRLARANDRLLFLQHPHMFLL